MRCDKCNGLLILTSETCMACGKPNPVFVPKVVQFTDPISTKDLAPVNGRPRTHFILTPNRRQVY